MGSSRPGRRTRFLQAETTQAPGDACGKCGRSPVVIHPRQSRRLPVQFEAPLAPPRAPGASVTGPAWLASPRPRRRRFSPLGRSPAAARFVRVGRRFRPPSAPASSAPASASPTSAGQASAQASSIVEAVAPTWDARSAARRRAGLPLPGIAPSPHRGESSVGSPGDDQRGQRDLGARCVTTHGGPITTGASEPILTSRPSARPAEAEAAA